MATTQPLTDAITALTTYANGVTGESDTTLSDAVRTLADGYGGGGGSVPKLVKQITFTPDTTYKSSNMGTFELEPITTGQAAVVLINIDTYPSAPDSTEYIALSWCRFALYGVSVSNFSAILRPAGTIGNDAGMCTFTHENGQLKVGGSYGHFMAGTTYHIYEFLVDA